MQDRVTSRWFPCIKSGHATLRSLTTASKILAIAVTFVLHYACIQDAARKVTMSQSLTTPVQLVGVFILNLTLNSSYVLDKAQVHEILRSSGSKPMTSKH